MGTLARTRMAVALVASLFAACGGGGGGGGGSGFAGLEDVDGDGQVIVIAFGDSITRGVGDGARPTDVGPGYPARLGGRIPAVVFSSGRPGERTKDGRPRLRQVLAQSRSDHVILLEGINDLEDGNSRRALQNLQGMVDDVFADGSMPVLGTLTPACCAHASAAPIAAIENFNAQVRAMAEANGILLIDFFEAFITPPATAFDPASGLVHTPEGLHPTPAGYDVMAEAAAEAFRRGVPPRPR